MERHTDIFDREKASSINNCYLLFIRLVYYKMPTMSRSGIHVYGGALASCNRALERRSNEAPGVQRSSCYSALSSSYCTVPLLSEIEALVSNLPVAILLFSAAAPRLHQQQQ